MAPIKRRDIETECLTVFRHVLNDLKLYAPGCGYGGDNRFDAGFSLVGKQRFQFGDLRVALPDRIVIVEVESGGGLTNLVKYWPLADGLEAPILLLHAFGQASANDYLSHLCLWDYVWQKMRTELWDRPKPKLFPKRFRFTHTEPAGLKAAAEEFRACLTQPLADVLRQVFGYVGSDQSTMTDTRNASA
jgi:hypothetical protein